jgi:hypothetical protein
VIIFISPDWYDLTFNGISRKGEPLPWESRPRKGSTLVHGALRAQRGTRPSWRPKKLAICLRSVSHEGNPDPCPFCEGSHIAISSDLTGRWLHRGRAAASDLVSVPAQEAADVAHARMGRNVIPCTNQSPDARFVTATLHVPVLGVPYSVSCQGLLPAALGTWMKIVFVLSSRDDRNYDPTDVS